MKLCLKLLAILTIAVATYSIFGCAGPSGYTYQNVTVSISAQCADCPAINYNPANPAVLNMPSAGQGGVTLFTATVTNAPANVTWTLYPTPNLTSINTPPTGTSVPIGETGSQVGTLVASGSTALYTQNGVPVYTGAALAQAQAMGIGQGQVLLVASVPNDPANPSSVTTARQLIQIYNGTTSIGPPSLYLVPRTPTSPSGLTDSVAFVPKGGSYQFYGGAVGAAPCLTASSCGVDAKGNPNPIDTTDNSVIWETGPSVALALPGGSTLYGTISPTGLYTAPTNIPPTAPGLLAGQVAVVLVSHALPTVTAVAYVTIY